MFLLSPANLSGERAQLIFNDRAGFALARQIRTPAGAPLGDVFSFVSGLYFRGKLTYAQAFGAPPPGLPGALVITAGEGLRYPEEAVTIDRLRRWADVPIDTAEPRYLQPLVVHAEALARATASSCEFVLLGSIASAKYVDPFLRAFGERLLFPSDFVGRGDMGRGALLLRAARAGRELPYVPVAGARVHGPRARNVHETFAAHMAADTDDAPEKQQPAKMRPATARAPRGRRR